MRHANEKALLFEAVIAILKNDYGVQVVKTFGCSHTKAGQKG
jgi:hypothetical protein